MNANASLGANVQTPRARARHALARINSEAESPLRTPNQASVTNTEDRNALALILHCTRQSTPRTIDSWGGICVGYLYVKPNPLES